MTDSLSRTESLGVFTAAALAAFAAGCSDSEIKTYRVAKEDNKPLQVAAAPHAHGHQSSLPHLHWQLPAGWKELQPDRLKLASFQVSGPDGKLAQVAIIPLPGVSDIELDSVNMWREELNLPAISEEELQAETIEVADFNARLVDLVGESRRDSGVKMRTLGAIGERNGILWFIKMSGDDALVAAQKPTLVNFLKTLEIHDQPHGQMAAAEQPLTTNIDRVPESAEGPHFTAPSHWTQKAPGPMVTAAYTVKGDAGTADIAISSFPGDVGGVPANVNRWREQLGLQSLPEADARAAAKTIEVNGIKNAYMVDLRGTNPRTGKPARMISIGVPKAGETWFYKMTGDDEVVEKEKDAFVQFVQNAH